MKSTNTYRAMIQYLKFRSTTIPMGHELPNPSKNRILRNIARIGSLPFQEAACLQGDSQEYILIDELIETTLSRAELELTNEVLAQKWSQMERDALRGFVVRVNELFETIAWNNEAVTLTSIIKNNPSMQLVRKAANECLSQMRVSFSIEQLLAD